jgi:hypothetical protein
MIEIKGFITNLGKYNEGELVGKWITFPIDEDDLQEVLKEIGCCYEDEDGNTHNEEYEEYFFTDWEAPEQFGEYEDIEFINQVAEDLEQWDDDTLIAACEVWSFPEIISNSPDDYKLYTDIKDYEDLGYYWIEESGCYDTKALGNLANYINYAAFGRDVAMESNGDFSRDGWIEYVG